jgi:membrane fusion protein, copper/silver efflux system
MKLKLIAGVLALAVLVLLVLLVTRGCADHRHETPATSAVSGETATVYSCPMHPQIRQPEFGQCPLCGMDLVLSPPMDGGDDRAADVQGQPAGPPL